MSYERQLNAMRRHGGRAAASLAAWCGRLLAASAASLVLAGAAQAQLIISDLPDSPDPVSAGGTVTYTVRVAETNGAPLSGGSFSFSVPANGVYAGTGTLPTGVSCSGMSSGQSGPGTLSCSGINLGANDTVQIPLLVRSTAQGTMSVTATPTPGGAPQTELTTVNAGADLELSIGGPASAAAGSTQTYTLTVLNNGPDSSPSSVVSYSVPPGFALSSTPGGCSLAGSTLTCTLASIASGNTRSVSLTGVIGAGGGSTITHTADVAATGGVGDGVSANNTDTLNASVTPGSAISVTKTKSVADPVATGTTFNFTLDPRYSGDYPVGVQVDDNVPAAFCYAGGSTSFTSNGWSCTASSSCPSAAPAISCTRGGSGAAGANVALGNIVIPVQAIATGSGVINTASISAPGVATGNGSVATTVIDPVSDFRANKSKSWPQAAVPLNTAFDYSVSTTNLGPTAFPSSGVVTLTDTVPAGLQVNSVTPPSGFSCTSSGGASFPQAGPVTITCTSTGVAVPVNGTTGSVTLNAQATSSGATLTNQVCVGSAGGPVDDNAPNDCASVGVTPQDAIDQADISTLKRVVGTGDASGNRQLAGDAITWEIEVVNAGPNAATDVTVTDVFNNVFNASASDYSIATLPGTASFASCSLTTGSSNVSLNNCSIATLPVCTAGVDCPRIQVSVRHFGNGTSGSDNFQVTNSAFALAQDQGDNNLSNNTSATTTAYFVARTDVAVTKTDNPDPVPAGQTLTYTVTARNPSATSASTAFNVSVTDTLPEGLVFLSASASGSGNCSVTPGAGNTTSAVNRTLTCGWSSISRGGQQTVTIRVRPPAALSVAGGGPGSITNSVTISTTTPEIAGGAANNTATQSTAVTSPVFDLLVNKTDDADPVDVGDDVTYTLTATNNRASTAENVVLTDTLPAGAGAPTFVEVVAPLPAGVSCDTSGVTAGSAGGSIACTIAQLGGTGSGSTGETSSVAVQVRLRGADKGQFTNQAAIGFADASMNAFDALPGNNTASQPTTFRFKADVEVVDKRAVQPGTATAVGTVSATQTFDWLVVVRNNGPQAAETTTFSDTLPAGIEIADAPSLTITSGSFTPAAPTCSGAVGTSSVSCSITSMPAGGAATVRIPVRFSGSPANGTSFTNTASIVTTGSGDTNGGANASAGNNFNSGSVTVQTSVVSGRVYHDQNANGGYAAGEPGIASTITLTGTDDFGQAVNLSTTSDATTGAFSFSVPPGTYTLTQTQPAGYAAGITRAGTASGAGSSAGSVPTSGAGVVSGPNGSNANVVQNIVLGTAGQSVNNLFGEVRTASLAGRVYQDADYSGSASVGEPGIAAVTLQLSGTDMFGNAVSQSTTSAANTGDYSYTGLWPGVYAVAETSQPDGYADGSETAGSAGGNTAVNDRVTAVTLASAASATGYDFGELRARVLVQVFEDGNNDGNVQAGESGITGVALRLTGTDATGNPVDLVATPVSGQPGHYEFRNVPPSGASSYTITETQPATYAPGQANANGNPGTAQPGGNVITGVVIPVSGTPATVGEYLFGELTSSQIRGRVYYDRDGDGTQDLPGEPGLAGVAITLTGTDDNGNPVTVSTTTDANGDYVFDAVAPGVYSVTETRPAGYLPGLTRAGTVNGAGSTPGSVPTSGSGVTAGPNGSDANRIQGIRLGAPGASSSNNNFSAVRAAGLAGVVYVDVSPTNGQRDAGEPGIDGVSVSVSGTDLFGRSVTRSLTTGADGSYGVDDLLPGSYRIDETQPSGVNDGTETLGTVGGSARGTANPGGVDDRFGAIVLASEEAGIDYDFGERGGQLAGEVYVDSDNDGTRDAGERGIAGVTLTLTGRSSTGTTVNLTATTDADGHYSFEGLLPSDASGYTITETQPATYADGLDTAGRFNGTVVGTAGDDAISGIVYTGGNGDGYLFGERGASLAGLVFNDANRNGVREPGDLPLAGVTITLTGTDATGQPVNRTATTGPDGRYRFDDLPLPDGAGYMLTQTQPAGYDNGGERPGSLGGTVPQPNRIVVPLTTVGAQGIDYDFYEQSQTPSALTGTVWRDTDHDRTRSGDEPVLGGWTVELLGCPDGSADCAFSDVVVHHSVSTAADGSYRFDQLVPGNYQVRFRSPSGQVVGGVWPTDPVQNGSGGAHPTVPGMQPRPLIAVTVGSGVTVVNQDLPLDPSGIVYDSLNAQPVPGAVVTLNGPAGFDPAAHLLGGEGSVTTQADGVYQFFLLPGAPAGDYTLSVVPPSGYVNSLTYLPAAGPLNAQTCSAPAGSVDPSVGDPCIVSPGLPAPGVASPYFLSLFIPASGAQNVVNNHLPLDPEGNGAVIELRKTSPKLTVKKGELVPYVITARNTRAVALGNVVLVDTLPPGFKYVTGSLSIQRLPGGAVESVRPLLEGRRLTVPARSFAANETQRLTMVLGVGTGVGEGLYVNQVTAVQGVGGPSLSNTASATVRVVPDALFDCTDVIGKVYDDKNANGYQDDGEPGIPNVRLATVNGLLVSTDVDGRYHIACAIVPKEGTGSNFVLKLDERTLPSGYRVTSENPASERATRGKFIKVNFGATVHRVVRLDLQAEAFEPEAAMLKPAFEAQLPKVIEALLERPSILRLAYRPAADEAASLGDERIDKLKADLRERWRRHGAEQQRALFNLDIEVERVPASVKP
ncbi:SpaA isopeptide-forming pilin-related protein [Schlegelella sp. S2-27]|uniref:SpaA isopeptide-forming pilin-related protein n=1 Tax=Caldimonas mangrovi TaxID=2944811 RepID=A0ABT0YP07_9BURK|nr:SdrD B-like domain-containing protein [Caldimonas mangrovi]MCM5680469.1 SpaA isopeptide-forming pilin-related protein [Caldimonas mangrovi]